MSTQMVWVSVLAVVVIVGGTLFYFSGAGVPAGDSPSDSSGTADSLFTGSWSDLVTRGGTYTCAISHDSAVDATTGIVYVSGTDVRGEFTSETPGGPVTSNMLKKGDEVFVWTSAYSQGFKMQASAMNDGAAGQQEGAQGQAIDANQEYSWNCTADTPDTSRFTVPTDIDFVDLADMMQGGATPAIPRY